MLACSEARFQGVQAWVQAHWSRVAEVRRPEPDAPGALCRTLVFHPPSVPFAPLPTTVGAPRDGDPFPAAGTLSLGGIDGSWLMEAYWTETSWRPDGSLLTASFRLSTPCTRTRVPG